MIEHSLSESAIYKVLELVRGSLSIDDYDVLLLIASLAKDGLWIEKKGERYNITHLSGNNNSQYPFELQDKIYTYHQLLDIYKGPLGKLGAGGLDGLKQLLSEEKRFLEQGFKTLFESLLYQLSQSRGAKGAINIQPIELTQFMCELASPELGDLVYNPFAGYASLGVYMPAKIKYFGQEINKKVWAIGTLRLMAHGKAKDSIYLDQDAIRLGPSLNEKFDIVISSPPFGFRIPPDFISEYPECKTAEAFTILSGMDRLKENGKLIAIVANGFLFNQSHEKVRKKVLESGFLEMIIALPGGLFLGTGIGTSVIVINKSKVSESVLFIDARSNNFKEKKGDKIDFKSLLWEINEHLIGQEDSNFKKGTIRKFRSALRHTETIRESGYDFSVPRYLMPEVHGTKLKYLLTPLKASREIDAATGKVIRARELNDGQQGFFVDLKQLNELSLNKKNVAVINQSCLLVSQRWSSLKPTFFNYNGTEIYKSLDIRAFTINSSQVLPEYLIHELRSGYVKEQADALRIGDAIPIIRDKDLLEIVIKLPSIEEQKLKVEAFEEVVSQIEIIDFEKASIEKAKTLEYETEFQSLKHTLGTPRQSIVDWTANLIMHLEENSTAIIAVNESFKGFYTLSIIDALKQIRRDINFITEVLEKGERGLILRDYKLTYTSFQRINEMLSAVETMNTTFDIEIETLDKKKFGFENGGVLINQTLFKVLIDNILTNASKYGFDKKEPGNRLVIECSVRDHQLLVEFRNNGKPFPKNFSKEKFILKYSTADNVKGTGIGGYDIHRIASHFGNPDWELILNEDPIYPVKYLFRFNITSGN